MGLLHAASAASAVIVNRCRLESSALSAQAFELKARDLVEDRELSFRARAIVNAAGAQLEPVARLLGQTCSSPPLIRGVNVVLGRDLTPATAIGAKDRGRFLFLVPWLSRSMLGTLYDDGKVPVEGLVRELMEAGRRAFPWARIRDEDVRVVQAGHVPGAMNGEPIYRSRLITHADPRILSILTAKYTTARATAEAAVDRIGQALSRSLPASKSAFEELPLAKPLQGTLSERMGLAMDAEMALSRKDAWRGRLIEGALGDEIDSGGAGA